MAGLTNHPVGKNYSHWCFFSFPHLAFASLIVFLIAAAAAATESQVFERKCNSEMWLNVMWHDDEALVRRDVHHCWDRFYKVTLRVILRLYNFYSIRVSNVVKKIWGGNLENSMFLSKLKMLQCNIKITFSLNYSLLFARPV